MNASIRPSRTPARAPAVIRTKKPDKPSTTREPAAFGRALATGSRGPDVLRLGHWRWASASDQPFAVADSTEWGLANVRVVVVDLWQRGQRPACNVDDISSATRRQSVGSAAKSRGLNQALQRRRCTRPPRRGASSVPIGATAAAHLALSPRLGSVRRKLVRQKSARSRAAAAGRRRVLRYCECQVRSKSISPSVLRTS